MENPPHTTPGLSAPPPPPPFGTPRPRELRRRPDRGPLGGVCAGLAEYFAIDPVIVRIAAVVLAISGPGIPAYILAWIFVPPAGDTPPEYLASPPPDRHDRGAQIFGIVLLALSVSILWGGWWSPARRFLFPVGLMVLGGWLILRRDGAGDEAPTAPAGTPGADAARWSAPWDAAATSTAVVGASGDAGDAAVVGVEEGGDASLAGDTTAETSSGAGRPPWAGGPWGAGPPPQPTEADLAARRRRRLVAPIVMGALLVWTGIAVLAGVSVQSGLAIALCIVGVGFVLGAFVGGAKGLVVPAFFIGLALVVTSIADIPLSGPVGERSWSPESIAEVADHYQLSAGEGTLDLTGIPFEEGDRLEIQGSIGFGHLVIEVPDGVTVDIEAKAAAGDITLLGKQSSGVGISHQRSVDGTGPGQIVLDLQVGFGEIDVTSGAPSGATTTTLR
jgi:phage shock protein PspC (stress-responsive transcriptional regulator)